MWMCVHFRHLLVCIVTLFLCVLYKFSYLHFVSLLMNHEHHSHPQQPVCSVEMCHIQSIAVDQ